jgi:hypothetical protein
MPSNVEELGVEQGVFSETWKHFHSEEARPEFLVSELVIRHTEPLGVLADTGRRLRTPHGSCSSGFSLMLTVACGTLRWMQKQNNGTKFYCRNVLEGRCRRLVLNMTDDIWWGCGLVVGPLLPFFFVSAAYVTAVIQKGALAWRHSPKRIYNCVQTFCFCEKGSEQVPLTRPSEALRSTVVPRVGDAQLSPDITLPLPYFREIRWPIGTFHQFQNCWSGIRNRLCTITWPLGRVPSVAERAEGMRKTKKLRRTISCRP